MSSPAPGVAVSGPIAQRGAGSCSSSAHLVFELSDSTLSAPVFHNDRHRQHLKAVPSSPARTTAAVANSEASKLKHVRNTARRRALEKILEPSFQRQKTQGVFRRTKSDLLEALRPLRLPELKPKGPGCHDNTAAKRTLNILTSLPLIAVGVSNVRRQERRQGRVFDALLAGVGVAATAYHSSWGRVQPWLRRLDYWSIAAASTALVSTLVPSLPRHYVLASAACTPFQPFAVSCTNFAAAEGLMLRKAATSRKARQHLVPHLATATLAGLCFVFDDAPLLRDLPYTHSLWHCLAAGAMATASSII